MGCVKKVGKSKAVYRYSEELLSISVYNARVKEIHAFRRVCHQVITCPVPEFDLHQRQAHPLHQLQP